MSYSRYIRWSVVVAAFFLVALMPHRSSADPSLGQLQGELSQQQSRAQSLSDSVAKLSATIASLTSQIALVESREAAVRADLARDRAELKAVQERLAREQRLIAILRANLSHARMLLARQLVSSYESDKPDLVSVVLEASGFKQLLERLTFLRDAQHQQQQIIAITQAAKKRADTAETRLASLEATDRQITAETAIRV